MTHTAMKQDNLLSSRTPAGTVKEDRYKWIIDDEPGELKYLDKELIHVHPDYQRPLLPNKVKELTAQWSYAACGALSIGHDNGIYWVYDGQHRLAAAKRRESIKTLPCVVFPRMNTKAQAAAFVKSNINRKQVTAFAKYNALIVSEDVAAHKAKTIFDDLGLTLTGHPRQALETKCIAWALAMCGKDESRCRRVLTIAAALSTDSGKPIPDHLLDALAWIDGNVEGGLANKRLVDRMREVGLVALVSAAKKAAEYFKAQTDGNFTAKNKGSAAYGRGVMDRVNSRMRSPFVVKA